jgi:predicted MPP superfamily phosphohydrolase
MAQQVTFNRQLEKYDRRAKLTLYVTGGLGGLGPMPLG